MNVAIYLRKSRADEELEKTIGQGETLSKHRKALLKFAKDKDLNIVEIKEEIVSGESLFHRPKMIELLNEVESKMYEGVLVMDIQRLGRGDMQEQGIILKTFKTSSTKIITPQKTYDLSNDWDEEYSEFEAFMSRKELKMINRRMQGGRVRSVEDGNYIATNAPLGYDITHINKNRTLKINEEESEIVKLIFKMYIDGDGAGTIAQHLNMLGYKTKFGNDFESSAVLFTLRNLVYIGKLTWKKKEIKKSKDPNKVKDTRTRDVSEWIVVDGKHPAIIDEDTFYKAQEILNGKYHIPYKTTNGAANPFAGLIICKVCGSKMVMRKYGDKDPHIICTKKCGNKSSKFKYIESAIIEGLEDYLKIIKTAVSTLNVESDVSLHKKHLDILTKELSTLNTQKFKLYDLLEQGIYDNNTFLERSQNITERSNKIEVELKNIQSIIEQQSKKSSKNLVVTISNVIDVYRLSNNIAEKNELLKSSLIKIEYIKTKEQRGDEFEIALFPRE